MRALEDALRESGLSGDAGREPRRGARARERGLVSDLVTRLADGLVLKPASDRHEYLLSEHRAGLPLVFVDRRPHGLDWIPSPSTTGSAPAPRCPPDRGRTSPESRC